jgi:hypothetical protein
MKATASLDATALIAPAADRRTFQRYAMNMLVFVRLPEPNIPAMSDISTSNNPELYLMQAVSVKDLSMTGLFFYSTLSYPSGSELEVTLCLNGVEFQTAATLERRVRIDNRICGYGLNFQQSQTSRELRVALAAHLLRHDCRVTQCV